MRGAMQGNSGEERRIVRAILRWYRTRGRRLPWRRTRDPYRVLLSEIMLQQTQVVRVLRLYPSFLRRFPDFRTLARAPRRAVVVAWRGFGYNARAVRLHALAKIVVQARGGRLPSDEYSLRMLPGVGRYTAAAILSAVYRRAVPVVDVNIRRVLSRLLTPMPSTTALRDEEEIWALALQWLPRSAAYEWNQALMDLGATICTARSPRCNACPVAAACVSRIRMRQGGTRPARREPSRSGIPDRIYRGRVVEQLRRRGGRQSIGMRTLGRRVLPGFSQRDVAWFQRLLAGLERDGLVRINGAGNSGKRQVVLQ